MFTRHKDRKWKGDYLQIGSYKLAEFDLPKFWVMMCGDEAIKKFLSQCKKEEDGKYSVPELKCKKAD